MLKPRGNPRVIDSDLYLKESRQRDAVAREEVADLLDHEGAADDAGLAPLVVDRHRELRLQFAVDGVQRLPREHDLGAVTEAGGGRHHRRVSCKGVLNC